MLYDVLAIDSPHVDTVQKVNSVHVTAILSCPVLLRLAPAGAASRGTLAGSDILNAKLLRPPCQEFVELRLGGPDNLFLQHFYQPIDRGIADYGSEHPVVLVLKVNEHREWVFFLLKDGDERNHVVRHGGLQFEWCR